ncbi:MAG TPA: zf-HC2 domain-containing protein [Planctomycetota bacterium]
MNCPESEVLAAHADGGLESEESARLLEHAAECESCRREMALLELSRAGAGTGLPARQRARALKAALRPRAPRAFARTGGRRSAVAIAAAAVALLAVGLLILAGRKGPSPLPVPKAPVARTERPEPAPEPARSEPERVRVEPPVPVEPPRRAEPPAPMPVPEPPKPEPAPLPEPAPEPPKAGETRPEPAAPPAHTVATRALSEIQLTDFSGTVSIKRKGMSSKERPAGMSRLAEGDVLSCEKAAGFRVGGVHPVVLGDNTTVSMAWAAQDQAPYIHVRAGEVTVDSTGPTRWIVSDGTVAVMIKQAQARFAATPGKGLRVSALSEPIYVQPDGGAVHALRPGEELEVAKASVETRPLEPGKADRTLASFHAARPRQKTIFFTSCDPSDAKREHFFVQEGTFLKNEALLSKERPDRSMAVALAPNPRFTWRPNLVLRFRVRTNAQVVTASVRADERRYTLVKDVAIARERMNAWVAVELPFPITEGAMGFARDDGMNQLTFTFEDKYDVLRFEAKGKDVFGDQKPYLLVDDIQVVVKD